jgi:hypothetical protein
MRNSITQTIGFPAHRHGLAPWVGAVTPRVDGFIRIRRSVSVSAQALWRETAPPD